MIGEPGESRLMMLHENPLNLPRKQLSIKPFNNSITLPNFIAQY